MGREPVSGYTHLVGGIAAVAGSTWLIRLTAPQPEIMLSALIYGCSLVTMYASSTALHLLNTGERLFLWLKRIDHASIFLLTAGSYTVVSMIALDGAWRWGMIGASWLIAVCGIGYKLFRHREGSLNGTLVYIAAGWLAVIALPKFFMTIPVQAIILFVIGGVVYTLGALIFYTNDDPKVRPIFGFHETWHLFVMIASILHFAGIAMLV